MILETVRLIIREFEFTDFESIHIYAKNPDVVQYMSWGPNTEEDTVSFIKNSIQESLKNQRSFYEMAIIDKKDGHFIGGIGLYILSQENHVAEVGYTINPNYWNMGYASDATQAIIAYGFEQLGLHRIEAKCDIRNIGSSKVMEKCGMTREGVIREHIYLRGEWRSSYLYSILEKDFFEV